jgi:beta-glucosidase/6-phospho-beta-glucosidase/beta-galactosidase/glycosyltransferase involved in cell wall biosynthesis
VPSQFIWGVGIESSCLPHIDVDQFEWTQHDRFWRDDLRRIRNELGVTHLRYALPWHKLETSRGKFDWSLADERIAFCDELGIELMMDVMHFGTPTWLPQAVGDPQFPEALESFASALVERYRGTIRTWCPFNEPLVSALFSGDFGFWPPFSRKWRGYMPVLSRIVLAVNRAIGAVRRAQPEATVLLCDALENFQSSSAELQDAVNHRLLRRFVVLDLLFARVDHHHPLYDWLSAFGFSELDLAYLRANPQPPDCIGLDYYPHSDWQLELRGGVVRQRRADSPLGVYELARATYNRYGLPMMVTETSVDGPPVSREIWLDNISAEIRQLRQEGVPLTGLIWWPLFDQVDWDGALTHRIGKLHRVGLYTLNRQPDGTLKRVATPLTKVFREMAASGEDSIGALSRLSVPAEPDDPQLPPLLTDAEQWTGSNPKGRIRSDNGNGHPSAAAAAAARRVTAEQPVAGLAGEPVIAKSITGSVSRTGDDSAIPTSRYGMVVFSHLRWGFVWQRPQQFISRFAKLHPVLFVEEPVFDVPPGGEPQFELHRVLPSVTVACPHCPVAMSRDPGLAAWLRQGVRDALSAVNRRGEFDQPLMWYYSPMDAAWSLGHFVNRGVVYDCMDELSQFTGAPSELIDNERRLMQHADVVFTGGYELWKKKQHVHPNVHFYGCGVEFEHFNQAQSPSTTIPPDIDFLARPILGWFGVVDERVDYPLLFEVARQRPEWSLAMVGPVVKVDPNLLPHAPNLHFLGGRDYQVLPNYCRAFDLCMMPFALNRSTEFINPTKALEYLATGRQVISTPVQDVVRQYAHLIEIARTPDEFVAKAERMIANPSAEKIRAGLELAASKTWENNVAQMRKNIQQAIAAEPRRSASAKPAPDPAPGFFYRHTPGS